MKWIKDHTYYFVLAISIIWLEMVFHITTGTDIDSMFAIKCILFSIGYGMVVETIVSLVHQQLGYKLIKGIVLLLCGIPYGITYFIYCKFNMFYDLNTVLYGAGDAATEFSKDIYNLVFCTNGIYHIFLFEAPFIVYYFYNTIKYIVTFITKKPYWGKKEKPKVAVGRFLAGKAAELMVAIVAIVLAIGVVNYDDFRASTYRDNYSFDKAINDYGVLTALRLEIEHKMGLKNGNSQFSDTVDLSGITSEISGTDIVPEAGNTTQAENSTTITQSTSVTANEQAGSGTQSTTSDQVTTTTGALRPEDYGYNKIDIDFKKIKKKASKDVVSMDEYVESLTASHKNQYTGLFKGKNLIFITAEAFTAEVIDKDLTPTLYRMAHKGIQFTDYYQPASAGTTGGEYSNIMGMLPTEGGSSMKMTEGHLNYMNMGYLLNELGYYGKAFHNNSYTYYDRDKTHVGLGYSDGYMGMGNGMEEYVQNVWPESDLEMIQGTFPTYMHKQPYNVYYMSVSGHCDYSYSLNAMARKNWDKVKKLKYSDTVKGYLASQIELENALNYLVDVLEKTKTADDTVIVISADHFPYGLDASGNGKLKYLSELYGCDINNNFVRDHNRLIMWSGCLEDMEPIVVDEPTFSPDILPTLCNLFGVEFDSRLCVGRDVLSDADPLVFTLGYEWKTNLGTMAGGVFTPVKNKMKIPDGYVSAVNSIVKNKINYSKGVIANDYYRHLFG